MEPGRYQNSQVFKFLIANAEHLYPLYPTITFNHLWIISNTEHMINTMQAQYLAFMQYLQWTI